MKLREIAHARTGDKGNISNISVIPYNEKDFNLLCKKLTSDVVFKKFEQLGVTEVKRYQVSSISALNYVLYNALSGGVTRSLALDAHGKSLSSYMLEIDVDM